MQRQRKILWGKAAAVLGAIPLLIWAHEYGPDAGYSNVPGELGTCAQSGCHLGTANNPANQGSVAVTFPNGQTYTPGVTQHLTVTISDPATTQKAWGFQLTARNSGSAQTEAGTFASNDANTLIMCAPANLSTEREVDYSATQPQVCPSNMPLQYIEHSLTGYNSTKGPSSGTYQFDWTPPATAVGNIIIYVAGNAANGDLTTSGDHIYTKTYTLTPSTGGGGPLPAITAVFNAAGYQTGIFPGSFISIQGSNLSPLPYADWSNSITNGKLPASLSGVSVMIAGKPAYIYQMIPGQINAQAPDVGYGSMQVTVTTPSGTSAPFTVNSQEFAPAFWQWPNNQPVATHPDFSIAAKNGTFTGTTTVAAKPGEIITLWGTGFGPVTPAVPAGQLPGSSAGSPTANKVTVTLNNAQITVIGAALSPYPADYQVAIQIPASLANGDYPLVATVNGVSSPTMTFSVHQ
ncbi:MAG TPA: choice-of-anchor V domain-containing protein [Bryobacteraceae bacterium]|nr:choice-of-anchor V domain-containing protein [Bryobacteraceae bacterium]